MKKNDFLIKNGSDEYMMKIEKKGVYCFSPHIDDAYIFPWLEANELYPKAERDLKTKLEVVSLFSEACDLSMNYHER